MKRTLVFLIIICVFNTLSCSPYTPKKEYKREDIFGFWEITKASLKKQKKNQIQIYSFQLNEDSTAIIFSSNSTKEKINGTWRWNIEKKIGVKFFYFSFKADVFLNGKNSSLGLLLEEKGGDMYLSVGDHEFKKKR
jgi:hypothetical protein